MVFTVKVENMVGLQLTVSLRFPTVTPEALGRALSKKGFVAVKHVKPLLTPLFVRDGVKVVCPTPFIVQVAQDLAVDPSPLLSCLNLVLETLESDFGADLKSSIKHLEFAAVLRVLTSKNPVKVISAYLSNRKQQFFSRLLGEPAILTSVRVVPRDRLPDESEWYDLTIEPLWKSPENRYYVHVVYRSRNVEKVLSFVDGVKDLVVQIIEHLEETA